MAGSPTIPTAEAASRLSIDLAVLVLVAQADQQRQTRLGARFRGRRPAVVASTPMWSATNRADVPPQGSHFGAGVERYVGKHDRRDRWQRAQDLPEPVIDRDRGGSPATGVIWHGGPG